MAAHDFLGRCCVVELSSLLLCKHSTYSLSHLFGPSGSVLCIPSSDYLVCISTWQNTAYEISSAQLPDGKKNCVSLSPSLSSPLFYKKRSGDSLRLLTHDSINLRSPKFYYGGCYLNQGPKTYKFVKVFTDLIVRSRIVTLMIVKLIFFLLCCIKRR